MKSELGVFPKLEEGTMRYEVKQKKKDIICIRCARETKIKFKMAAARYDNYEDFILAILSSVKVRPLT